MKVDDIPASADCENHAPEIDVQPANPADPLDSGKFKLAITEGLSNPLAIGNVAKRNPDTSPKGKARTS